MPEFKIRMPDGQIKTVSGPDRAGAMAFAKNNESVGFDNDRKLPAPKLAVPATLLAPADSQIERKKEQAIAKGTIVFVQARTWPGINKPGGVARVTKVHKGSNSIKYDIAYILGGKEKQVDESFVSLQESDPLPTIEECLDTSRSSRRSSRGVSMLVENKTRSMRHRRAAKTEPATSAAAPSIPIYNDEELKHIPADVLKWAGIVPKEKKGKKAKGGGGGAGKKDAMKSSRGKKRVLSDSNKNAEPKSPKKQKPDTAKEQQPLEKVDVDQSPEQDDQSNVVEALDEIIRPLPTHEIVSLADVRYSSLLHLDQKPSATGTLTLHAITSSLTDEDSKMFDSLRKMLKDKNGKCLNVLLELFCARPFLF